MCFTPWYYTIIDFFSLRAGSGTTVLHAVLKLVKWPNVDKYNIPIHGFFFSPHSLECAIRFQKKSTLIPSGSFGGKTVIPPLQRNEWTYFSLFLPFSLSLSLPHSSTDFQLNQLDHGGLVQTTYGILSMKTKSLGLFCFRVVLGWI